MIVAQVIRFSIVLALCALLPGKNWAGSGGFGQKAGSSEFVVHNWQTEQGLPQNSITSIAQTPDGFLWMGTFNGLVRFDGVKFRVFDSENTPELKSSRIVQVYVDSTGTLWIVSEFNDLATYREGEFRNMQLSANGKAVAIQRIGSSAKHFLIMQDRENRLYQYKDGALLPLATFDAAKYGRILSWDSTVDGNIWVATKKAFGFLEGSGWKIAEEHEANSGPEVIAGGSQNLLWISGRAIGIRKMLKDGSISSSFSWSSTEMVPTAVFEDSKQRVWVGTLGNGVVLWNGQKWENINTETGLSHDSVRVISEDREGNIWIGTDGGGLNRLRTRLFEMVDPADGLPGEVALSVARDRKNNLWIGLNNHGMAVFSDGKVEPIFAPPFVTSTTSGWSIFADDDGSIWTTDGLNGLARLRDGQVTQVANPDQLDRRYVRCMHKTSDGVLWVGDTTGLIALRAGKLVDYATEAGIKGADVRALVSDRKGVLYLGCNGGGLAAWKDGQFRRIGAEQGFNEQRIWSLCVDSQDVLWIGTFGHGLWRLKGGIFKHLSGPGGLPIKVVCSIIQGDRGNLWFSSLQGLFSARPKDLDNWAEGRSSNLVYRRFDKSDGLNTTEFSGGFQPASCKMGDGTLCFPTIKGVALVNPLEEQTVGLAQPRIDEVLIDGKAAPWAESNQIKIQPGSERLDINYTAIFFSSPEKVRFRYRLEGFDRNWVEASARRVAYYSHVIPGAYKFQVKACNSDGVWNESPAELAVVWMPHLWQTTWFPVSVLTIIVCLVASLARYISVFRLKERLANLEREHALQRERARIAQDLHDDMGSRLTQLTLLSELAKRARTPQDAGIHLGRIAENSRQMVQVMDEIVWAIDPQKDKLEDLATYLPSFAQEFLENSGIKGRFEMPAILPEIPLSAELRHNLFLVFQEALNNAVKHSQASIVYLVLKAEEQQIVIELRDDGRGFDPGAGQNGGNGLATMRKRLAAFGGHVWIESAVGKGTIVRIQLALQHPSK